MTGIDGTLPADFGPAQGWFWNGSVNYGRTSGTFTTGGSFRNSRVQSATGPSMLDAQGNPVCVSTPGRFEHRDPGLHAAEPPQRAGKHRELAADVSGGSRALARVRSAFHRRRRLRGRLVQAGGGTPSSLAFGYEYRHQLGSQIADPIAAAGDSADFNFQSTSGGFHSNEAFAELSIPILANIVGVEALEASFAARYVNYSTFGDKFTYKVERAIRRSAI